MSYKKILYLIYLLTIYNLGPTIAQSYEWARQIGGTYDQYSYSLALDDSGNVYTTGFMNGTVDFDPGIDSFFISANVYDDLYINKLDESGNFVWAKSFAGSLSEEGKSIAVDHAGFIYTIGNFYGSIDFDSVSDTDNFSTKGNYDIVILKLDKEGNFIWAKQIGGIGEDIGNCITVDDSSNIYITGYFNGTVDFDPGLGEFYQISEGESDIFVCKIDSAGNLVWAKSFGGLYGDRGYSISISNNEYLYTTGRFYGIVDFDPSVDTTNLISAGNSDIFINKLDISGNFIWAKRMGGTEMDEARSVQIDSSGNVYTTGFFFETADFDPGPDNYSLISYGKDDAFISKLDSNGNYIWAKQFGGVSINGGISLDIDNSGNVYTTGYFYTTTDFDPGPETFNLFSTGLHEIYISKLSTHGEFVWAKQLGGSENDACFSLAVDMVGNIYTTGCFEDKADFDPGPEVFDLISSSSFDIFIHKIGCYQSYSNSTVTACNSYTSPSGFYTWTSSGIYVDTIPNLGGCDSVITIDLTINSVDVSLINDSPNLIANEFSAEYQWLDCDDGLNIIPGETDQSFMANTSGNYAVQITKNGCIDTSGCEEVIVQNIQQFTIQNQLIASPNPTNGLVNIFLGESYHNVTLIIRNDLNQEVFKKSFIETDFMEVQIPGSSGVYFIEIVADNNYAFLRVLKN